MKWVWILLAPLALSGQPLKLAEAVRLAMKQHPAAASAGARVSAASHRIDAARAGYLPKVDYSESYMRSDNPVFVFSTLLTQRRFTEQNFAIGSLNRPDSINNFQSMVSAEQVIYDAGRTRRQVRAAELQRDMTAEQKRRIEMQVGAAAARAYLDVLVAERALEVAREAVRSAEADLGRAKAVRDAGMSTDADVLSIEVHLAAMREQEIARRSDIEVSRAALNEALGLPLDTVHQLETELTPLQTAPVRERYEEQAKTDRPDAREARLSVEMADVQASLARSAYLPQVSLRGVFEADRGKFVTQGGANWLAGVTLRWNVFNGFADRSRIRESVEASRAAQAARQHVESSLALEVRKAWSQWTAANERIRVAEAAVQQSEESLRITRNRYENGLSTVTDLLRNETARLEASLRRLIAIHDQRVAATLLELAAGNLTAESEALQ